MFSREGYMWMDCGGYMCVLLLEGTSFASIYAIQT